MNEDKSGEKGSIDRRDFLKISAYSTCLTTLALHGNPSIGFAKELYPSERINVIGTFFMTRAAVDHFLGQGKGKIINITTSVRHFYRKHESPYGVTKAGLEASTQIWARDLESKNISVNSLLPGGSTDTDPNRQGKPGEVLLAGDIMNPLLIWLASTQSDGVTGCRFVGNKWDSLLPPVQAAQAAREEPVFRDQPLGTFTH